MAALETASRQIWRFYAPTWLNTSIFRRGSTAWAVIFAFVLGYNVSAAGEGEMLSEQADRWIKAHPIAARLFVILLAAHVGNLLPAKADLVHQFFTSARKVVRN